MCSDCFYGRKGPNVLYHRCNLNLKTSGVFNSSPSLMEFKVGGNGRVVNIARWTNSKPLAIEVMIGLKTLRDVNWRL